MGVPRRLAIPHDCLSCALRRTCDFCNLPQPLMTEFNAMGHLTLYPANATLLAEGQIPRGVYIACSGRSKLSVGARDGKTIILKIAGDRQVLGLSAVVSGGPSLITVTTIELCQIKFVERDSFLRLLEQQQPRRARVRHPARTRGRDLVRRCVRPAARPQFDGETCPPAAFLGFGRTPQPGTPRIHGIHARRNRPNDRLFARNGNPPLECDETERLDPAGGYNASDSQPDRPASHCRLRDPSPGGRSCLRVRPFFVCRTCSTAWGWKSPAQPGGGEELEKRKGVVARRGLKEAWIKSASR